MPKPGVLQRGRKPRHWLGTLEIRDQIRGRQEVTESKTQEIGQGKTAGKWQDRRVTAENIAGLKTGLLYVGDRLGDTRYLFDPRAESTVLHSRGQNYSRRPFSGLPATNIARTATRKQVLEVPDWTSSYFLPEFFEYGFLARPKDVLKCQTTKLCQLCYKIGWEWCFG